MADGDNKKNPLGPTGERLRANLAHLREARGLTYKELSERLAAIGRVIPVLGLSRVEKGERRVDADDLVALAIALGTTPARLLLPVGGDEHDEVRVTPAVARPAFAAWEWAKGEMPIAVTPDAPGYMYPNNMTWGDLLDDFRRHSMPDFQRRHYHDGHTSVRAATDVLDRLREVLDGRNERRSHLRRALNRLIAEIDDLDIGHDRDDRDEGDDDGR